MSQHKQVIKVTNEANLHTKTKPGTYLYESGKKRKVVTVTGTQSNVDESLKDHTDLQKVLEPARKRELMRHVVKFEGTYDDIPAVELQDALNTVAKANQMFEALPRDVKNRFSNNPVEFLKFTNTPGNAPELQRLGLLKGNDGLKADGKPSGAPTATDKNGDGIPDPKPAPVTPTPA